MNELQAWREAFEAVPEADGQTQLWLRDSVDVAPTPAEALAEIETKVRKAADKAEATRG